MKKEDILESSRKENKNKDLAELEVIRSANAYGAVVGGVACCVILILASVIADTMLYGPFLIYLSMIGTNWFVRSIHSKKKSDWVLTGLFAALTVLAFIGFILRLLGGAV